MSCSARTRAGPSCTAISTVRSWHSPAPAVSVSAMCAANESAELRTAAIPPCAYLVFDSSALRFVMSVTSPCLAASSAKVSPATPLPMTR